MSAGLTNSGLEGYVAFLDDTKLFEEFLKNYLDYLVEYLVDDNPDAQEICLRLVKTAEESSCGESSCEE